MRNKNTIFKTGRKNTQQQWGFMNPHGSCSYYSTKTKAEYAKRIWRPQITQLHSAGLINNGDVLEMAFSNLKDESGHYKPIALSIQGINRNSMLFNHNGSVISLADIRGQIAVQLGLSNAPGLQPSKTVHVPTGKTLSELKEDYMSDFQRSEPEPNPKQLNLLDIFEETSPSAENAMEEEISISENSFSNYNNNFSSYSNKQFSIINEMSQLTDNDKEKLYKSNLTSLLSL